MDRPWRILVVNPNTTEAVTQTYVDAARAVAPEGMTFEGATGRFGAEIVMTEAENVIAGHAVLDLVAHRLSGHDAIILAISFDTGLTAIRDLVAGPVVAITEAALRSAGAEGRRVGVVCFGAVSRPLYARLIQSYGVDIAGLEAVDIASAADYLAPGAKDDAVVAACDRLVAGGAEAVVLCGAAIVGIAARLQPRVPVWLFDGLEAVAQCRAALEAGPDPRPRVGSLGTTTGLSPALSALMRGSGRD